MIVSAHQPHYLPWIGYIHRILLSDVFVLMDNMQYTKYNYISKNRILGKNGIISIVVPVNYDGKSKTLIKDVKIDSVSGSYMLKKHLKSITLNYSNCQGFEEFYNVLERAINVNEKFLIDLNRKIIEAILDYLQIKTKIILASESEIEGNKEDEMFLSLLSKTSCDKLLLGLGASKNYINVDAVKGNGYSILYQNFSHPIYDQKYLTFVKGISIIDLLLNVPKNEAISLISNSGKYND